MPDCVNSHQIDRVCRRAMLPEEKQDLSSFGPAERKQTAKEVGCTVGQVQMSLKYGHRSLYVPRLFLTALIYVAG